MYKASDNRFKKVWGSEIWIVNNDKFCGKFLNLKKGYRCSIHYHKIKEETFYIDSGTVLMEVNGKEYIMTEGNAIHIEPGVKHRFTGVTSARIIEFSTQHFEDDSYRVTKSEKVTWWKRIVVDRWRAFRGKTSWDKGEWHGPRL